MNKTNNALIAALETVTTDRDQIAAERDELQAKIRDLAVYLNTSKFSTDTSVQVADVLTRLGMR